MSDFSEKQLKILAFPKSQYDALICDGAVRTGKTSIMSVSFVEWAMQNFNKCNFAICSKTVGTAVKNVVRPLLAMSYMNKKYKLKYRRTDGYIEIQERGKGVNNRTNLFYLYGGKDEASYALIQGITLAGVFLDEVALMPRSFVEQALARCSVEGSKFWFNCNPDNQLHWFNQEWIMNASERNALHLHFVLDDNPSLSEKIKQRYRDMYTGVFYQRYILGLWVSAEGLVYDMFDPDVHVLDEVPETTGDYFVSADFGIQNATVFLLWRYAPKLDAWVCLDEYYYSGRDQKKQKTVSQLVDGLDDVSLRNSTQKDESDRFIPLPIKRCVVDPSATSLIVELRKRGYKVKNADNDVIEGINDVSTMLMQRRLYFMKNCKNTINEFGVYAWDPKATDRGEDKPIKENDHGADAVRYMVRTQKLVKRDKDFITSRSTGYNPFM